MTSALVNDAVAERATPSPTPPPTGRGAKWRAAEVAAIGLSPLVVFFIYRVHPMAKTDSIDPTLYTSYIQNGPDLIARFGPLHYYWSRLGIVVPGRIAFLLFGAVNGFFVLRYLLCLVAIVPAYVLFKRLRGPAAGALAVGVVLINPVLLAALANDYPSGAALAYLIGAVSSLLVPGVTRQRGRGRLGWLLASAVLFTAAVHCNVVVAALVAAVVCSYVVAERSLGLRALASDLAWLAAGFVLTTGVLLVLSKLTLHATNIIEPNRIALDEVSQGAYDSFHSTTWRWLLRETQLFVGPALLGMWLVLRWGSLRKARPHEVVLVLAAALQLAGFVYVQATGGSVLENFFYSMLLWGTFTPLTIVVGLALWEAVPTRGGELLGLAALAAVPVAAYVVLDNRTFLAWPWVPLLGAVVLIALVVVRVARVRRPTESPWTAALATILVFGVVFALTIGKPQNLGLLPGQAVQPQAAFGDVLFNPDGHFVDYYRIASQLIAKEPKLSDEPGALRVWWPAASDDIVQIGGATELWRLTSLASELTVTNGSPDLFPAVAEQVRSADLRFVLVIGDDTTQFDTIVTALATSGFEPHVRWTDELRSGAVVLEARLVELGTWQGAA